MNMFIMTREIVHVGRNKLSVVNGKIRFGMTDSFKNILLLLIKIEYQNCIQN